MTIQALEFLATTKFYTRENIKRVMKHPHPEELTRAFLDLNLDASLNMTNFELVLNHEEPEKIASSLVLLSRHHLLNDETTKILAMQTHYKDIAPIWVYLNKIKLFTPENRDRVVACHNLPSLFKALDHLSEISHLTQKSFEQIATHLKPFELSLGYAYLKNVHLLSPEHQERLAKHHAPEFYALYLIALHRARIMNQANLELIEEHPRMTEIAWLSWKLSELDVFSQDLLNSTISGSHYTHRKINFIVLLEKHGLFTAKIFNRIYEPLFQCLSETHNIVRVLLSLEKANILTKKNIYKLTLPSCCSLELPMRELNKLSILNQKNFDLLLRDERKTLLLTFALAYLHHHEFDPKTINPILSNSKKCFTYSTYYFLEKSGIFNSENQAIIDEIQQKNKDILPHEAIHPLFYALEYLYQEKLLTQDSFNEISKTKYPDHMAEAWVILNKASLFTPTYQAFLKSKSELADDITNWAICLSCLHKEGLLTEENKLKIEEYFQGEQLVYLSYVLEILTSSKLLNQACFERLIQDEEMRVLYELMIILKPMSALNESNFNAIFSHSNREGLYEVMNYLLDANILNQKNFQALISENHLALLSEEAQANLWPNIPMTQENFQRLLHAAEHHNPRAEIARVRNQILGVDAGDNEFNPQQSTHTTSVHHSVSVSALKLFETYGADLDTSRDLIPLLEWSSQLNQSPKNNAAKRCIKRLTAVTYTFAEPISRISTLQLLILAFRAIHDPVKRQSSLEDAIKLFVEGLYEIQRGYNLNSSGEDLGGEDVPICAAGTFNKIIEKLNGIHADVALKYITHELASIKFPILAQEVALNYLKTLANPSTPEDYRAIKILLATLELDQSLEPIWDKLKDDMTSKLWEEFHEAYADNQEHPKFKELIEYGASLNLPALDSVEHLLYASPGYRAYVTHEQAQCSISFFSLFTGQESERLESDRPQKRIK